MTEGLRRAGPDISRAPAVVWWQLRALASPLVWLRCSRQQRPHVVAVLSPLLAATALQPMLTRRRCLLSLLRSPRRAAILLPATLVLPVPDAL